MRTKNVVVVGVVLLLAGIALPVLAQSTGAPTPQGVMDMFKTSTSSFGKKTIGYAGKLLFALAAIQIVWNSIEQFLKGSFELKSVMANLVRTSLVTTFFFTLIFKSQVWFLYILDQWSGMGAAASGTAALDPGGIMTVGIDMVMAMYNKFAETTGGGLVDTLRNVLPAMQLLALSLIVLFSFFVLAGQLALAMIKGYLWLCVGPLLIGFGGLKTFRDIAINSMKAAISTGVVIFTVYVLMGIFILMQPMWSAELEKFKLSDWSPFFNIAVSAGLLALTAWQIPKIANDFINGSVSGGMSETAGAAMTMAAGGAALAAGGAASMGAGAGAGQGALSSLNGVMNAINAGMGAAGDAGHTGPSALLHGAASAAGAGMGMAANKTMEMGKQVLDNIQNGSKETIGGKIAAKLEAERGGAISMPGASPNVGTGDASSASLSGGDGGSRDGGGGGRNERSVAEKIQGLQSYVPDGGDANVSVGGGHGGMSESVE